MVLSVSYSTQVDARDPLVEGKAYLEKNKKLQGVVVLDNGLQYKILKAGSGDKPNRSNRVEVHYKGTLIDGTEFDSSYSRNAPLVFGLGQVIKGWQEILPMMPVGSKWQVVIPSHLAYGARGAGRAIGPNETLVFDIELLGIK
jgi:FKBP-type peptidyl-prolyl cis-trans isomerase FklB